MTIRMFVALALVLAAFSLRAGDCKKTGSVCVDATPCKTISGQQVCLSQFGLSCWEYEDTYTCIKPNAVNYCQPFVNAQPQCWQTNSQCSQWDSVLNTGCMKYTQTWRCGSPLNPTPVNTVRLDDSYTLVTSDYDASPCQSMADNANCQLAESRCIQTTPDSLLPPGIDPAEVAPDGCYKRENLYACLTGQSLDECAQYAGNPNCTLQSSVCEDLPEERISGQCIWEERTYQCMTSPPGTTTVTDCAGQVFCMDGKCFDTGYTPDQDFGTAIALMEAAREAGVYMDPESLEIFKGVGSKCRIKLGGLANCCKESDAGAGMSNAAMAAGAAVEAGKFFGSPYMYDAMFASDMPWLVDRAIDAWSATAWTSTTSFYGLTFSFSATEGLQFVEFNPTLFALRVGLMIAMELLSCEQSEQILALRRGQDLCHYVGSYCSRKVLGACIEKTRSYCCYNSRLARIINEQGRAQIGKSWGSAKHPDCSGFTQEQFARIDFSKIDLTEFTNEIMANAKLPDQGAMTQEMQRAVYEKVQNYYQGGHQ